MIRTMQNNEILMLPCECWRWHPEFEGIAQVSTWGQVKTVDRWVDGKNGSKRLIKGRILKPQRDKYGYLSVMLYRDGKRRLFHIHRLVAETWLDNPEGKPQVNHLNEQKDMNFVENLSWATRKENMTWGTRTKRQAASLSKQVVAVDPETGEVVFEFPSTNEAGRKGFDQGHVSACCNGKMLSHRGLVWRYKDDYDQESAWTPVKIGRETVAAIRSKAVQAINPSSGQVVKDFPSMAEAGRNGFKASAICNCCQGKLRTYKGLIWRYKES